LKGWQLVPKVSPPGIAAFSKLCSIVFSGKTESLQPTSDELTMSIGFGLGGLLRLFPSTSSEFDSIGRIGSDSFLSTSMVEGMVGGEDVLAAPYGIIGDGFTTDSRPSLSLRRLSLIASTAAFLSLAGVSSKFAISFSSEQSLILHGHVESFLD
jgi:hypothetical protein